MPVENSVNISLLPLVQDLSSTFASALGRAEPQKVDEPDEGAGRDGEGGAPGRAQRAQAEHTHKEIVQPHVQHQTRHRHGKPNLGVAVAAHQILKEQLERHGHRAQKHHQRIGQHVGHQPLAAAQQHRDGAQKGHAQGGERHRKGQQHQAHEAENAVCLLHLAAAQVLADDGARPGGQHHRNAEGDAGDGDDDVDARQRVRTRIAGDEKAVDGGVERQKDHGQNAGQQAFQILPVAHRP